VYGPCTSSLPLSAATKDPKTTFNICVRFTFSCGIIIYYRLLNEVNVFIVNESESCHFASIIQTLRYYILWVNKYYPLPPLNNGSTSAISSDTTYSLQYKMSLLQFVHELG
jgi:hypothetical protein